MYTYLNQFFLAYLAGLDLNICAQVKNTILGGHIHVWSEAWRTTTLANKINTCYIIFTNLKTFK